MPNGARRNAVMQRKVRHLPCIMDEFLSISRISAEAGIN